VNESIHKLNEYVDIEELDLLSDIYQSILDNLLS
jgi:acetylornithine deacetylase/succinyl-diaminopimelate desuccinylase-like protein